MKYLLIIITIFCIACNLKKVKKTNNLDLTTIEINATSLKNTRVRLLSEDYKTDFWSDTISKNKLKIVLNIPHDGIYHLYFQGKYIGNKNLDGWASGIILYLEKNKKYEIVTGSDSTLLLHQYKVVSNSIIQNDLTKFETNFWTKFFTYKKEILNDEKKADSLYSVNITEYETKWQEIINKKNYHSKILQQQIIRNFATDNPKSVISVYELLRVDDLQENYNLYNDIYESLDLALKNSVNGVNFKRKLDAVKKVSYGKIMPDVVGYDLNGNLFLSNYEKNKITYVDFWASWCKPCRDENPLLVKIYREYKNKGFNVISVSLDNDKNLWNQAILKDSLIWDNHYSDLKTFNKSENTIKFNLGFIPQNYLVDKKGYIITKNIELDSLAKFLKTTL